MFDLDFDFSPLGILYYIVSGFIEAFVGTIVGGIGDALTGIIDAASYLPTLL